VHQLFIDFKKAYDSVRREFLYNILIEFGIPMELVRLIKMCLNETCSRVHVGKHVSDMFPIRNEYAVRSIQENQDDLKLNGTHHLLVDADDVNILGGSIHTREENMEALVVASKEIG